MSLQQNIRKRLSGWCLWGFEPFSHGNHHIRVYMHHVCLVQSISARKAAHIKLCTCSGSSQCQLHFGTKMVSIGWSGCEWLPSECKNAHFQAFPLLTPSGMLLATLKNWRSPSRAQPCVQRLVITRNSLSYLFILAFWTLNSLGYRLIIIVSICNAYGWGWGPLNRQLCIWLSPAQQFGQPRSPGGASYGNL